MVTLLKLICFLVAAFLFITIGAIAVVGLYYYANKE